MNLIECQGVSKFYGDKHALHDVSFSISEGAPIALVGPNGAGKSTLFSILCGYLNPSAGEVSVLGYKPGDLQLSGKISALPQDAQLNPLLRVGKQLSFFARIQGFGAQEALKETQRVLALMELSDSIDALPTELSHGMKKRVAIAQTLLGSPELVLLDEPTAGLDPQNTRNIRAQLMGLSGDTTFLISSHNLDELERLCSKVLYLDQGELKLSQAIGDDAVGFISVRLKEPAPALLPLVEQLPGVQSVEWPQVDVISVQYDQHLVPQLDVELLTLLYSKGIRYRQLSVGQSLEEQLFISAS